MLKDEIAIIGDKDSILLYKSIGFNVYPVVDESQARELFKSLAMNYKIIYIVDTLQEKISDLTDKYKNRSFPAVIPLPSCKGSNGLGMQGIKENVEKAIGADILFANDKKDKA